MMVSVPVPFVYSSGDVVQHRHGPPVASGRDGLQRGGVLQSAGTGMVVEALGFPLFTHELFKVWLLHPFLKLGDPVLYPRDDIAALYDTRWCVETRFSELKTTLKMRGLKAKTQDGVLKKLAAYCLVYNMVRAVTAAAALIQKVESDRISFMDALPWLLSAAPGAPIPRLVVNPIRENRHEPRGVKERHASYPRMTRPRAELRKALKNQGKSLK